MYETFDHTADLGLRIRAGDLETLFAEAGEALFSTIVENLSSVEAVRTIEIELEADDLPFLLFDWLNRLLVEFDAEGMLFARFEARVEGNKLSARATGEPLDWDRHELNHEVKAITYHELRVEEHEGEWLAEVIVDI